MDSKKTRIAALILIAVIQLAVPAWMVMRGENVLKRGNEFRFKTAPVDPHDPFRGKYITLRYSETSAEIKDGQAYTRGQEVYVLLTTDAEGFAKIASISKSPPSGNPDYVKAIVRSVSATYPPMVQLDYPFNRYYMEETKAAKGQDLSREATRDTSRTTYASVYVMEGEAVLHDVLIDGVSLKVLAGEE